jgi:hypothetical protein
VISLAFILKRIKLHQKEIVASQRPRLQRFGLEEGTPSPRPDCARGKAKVFSYAVDSVTRAVSAALQGEDFFHPL